MNTRVGAAGGVNVDRCPFDRRQRIFDQPLNRNTLGLALPAYEVRTVVGKE